MGIEGEGGSGDCWRLHEVQNRAAGTSVRVDLGGVIGRMRRWWLLYARALPVRKERGFVVWRAVGEPCLNTWEIR
jgi:hypothetical protein